MHSPGISTHHGVDKDVLESHVDGLDNTRAEVLDKIVDVCLRRRHLGVVLVTDKPARHQVPVVHVLIWGRLPIIEEVRGELDAAQEAGRQARYGGQEQHSCAVSMTAGLLLLEGLRSTSLA